MRDFQKGMYARSLAGHDKGRLHIIVSVDDAYVYLADGKVRTLDHPKKKKHRHVQADSHIDPVIMEKMNSSQGLRDEDVKRAIKLKEAQKQEVRNVKG
ncbi:MAG: hypothetical protein ACOX8H_13080 [Ruminococcus sp.]|jgi:ribosomal protein L14E/L6E/L27E